MKINNQAALNDQFNQWLAVDETNGRIGDHVLRHGRRRRPQEDRRLVPDLRSTTASTWSAPFKVTTAQTDETVAGADTASSTATTTACRGWAGTFFAVVDRPAQQRRARRSGRRRLRDARCTPPAAPTGLTATAVGTSRIDLSWSAVAGRHRVPRLPLDHLAAARTPRSAPSTDDELLRHRPDLRHDLLLRRARLRAAASRATRTRPRRPPRAARLHDDTTLYTNGFETGTRPGRLDARAPSSRGGAVDVVARHPDLHGADRHEDLPLRRHELHRRTTATTTSTSPSPTARRRHRGPGRLHHDAPDVRPPARASRPASTAARSTVSLDGTNYFFVPAVGDHRRHELQRHGRQLLPARGRRRRVRSSPAPQSSFVDTDGRPRRGLQRGHRRHGRLRRPTRPHRRSRRSPTAR